MEERMIDDEYGRGVRFRKTKDGFVDVTDESLETENDEETGEEYAEEALFEFPTFDENDDEDMAMLTPEEAMALKKQKEEERARRQAEYERLCAEGEEQLALGSFHTAELKFEKALLLDDEATEASVGYWRAKTEDFANPDALVGEYAESSIESLEFDLGYQATDIIRKKYEKVFLRRIDELTAEEEPLAQTIEEKQAKRRTVIRERLKKSGLATAIAAVPAITLLILTIVFAFKIFSVVDDRYIVPTIVLGAAFLVAFIVFILVANKLINNWRMHRTNERLSASDEGLRLMEIRDYKTIYLALLPEKGDETETAEEQNEERELGAGEE